MPFAPDTYLRCCVAVDRHSNVGTGRLRLPLPTPHAGSLNRAVLVLIGSVRFGCEHFERAFVALPWTKHRNSNCPPPPPSPHAPPTPTQPHTRPQRCSARAPHAHAPHMPPGRPLRPYNIRATPLQTNGLPARHATLLCLLRLWTDVVVLHYSSTPFSGWPFTEPLWFSPAHFSGPVIWMLDSR